MTTAQTTLLTEAATIALSIANSRYGQDGDDIGQETYFTLERRIGEFDAAKGNLNGWVANHVRQTAVDRFRKDGAAKRGGNINHVSIGSPIDDNGTTFDIEACFDIVDSTDAWKGTPLQVAIGREQRAMVRAAVNRLPQSQRQLLEARQRGEFTSSKMSMAAMRIERKLKAEFAS